MSSVFGDDDHDADNENETSRLDEQRVQGEDWVHDIDALSAEFSRKWEMSELEDIDFIVHSEQKPMYDDE